MRLRLTIVRLLVGIVLALTCSSWAFSGAEPVSYVVDLRAPFTHLAAVTMTVPEAKARTQIQFPAWTALYQIRDFVRNVLDVRARCNGEAAELVRLDVVTWSTGSTACPSLEVRYSVYVNEDSVFLSVLDEQHAYLNLAMVLFYLPEERGRPVRVRYKYPAEWKLATFLPGPDASGWYTAENYDELVDSPAEASMFQKYRYEQNGAEYRIIVHAEPKAYDASRLVESVKKITAAATALMQDVPFSRFTFLYHFPRESSGGGQEHRDGTTISVHADTLRANRLALESLTAHEFVHTWNVKRTRPQNLEPVDYIRGNDTSDLWFCEGVTSTLAEYVLLRAGLISKKTFYARLSGEINRLHERPARKFQSVEDSGREAWLEKYPDYLRPERSISYYNKGEIVGFLLDLAIRHSSGSAYGLDDLFHRLNEEFAMRGRYFTSEDLVRISYDLAPAGCDFRRFFRDNISGTQELDYDTYLGYAGLRLEQKSGQEPSLGFVAGQNADGSIIVRSVESGSGAQRAGLEAGDVLLEMNGQPLRSPPSARREKLNVGSEVQLRLRRDHREMAIRFHLDSAPGTSYAIQENGKATEAQRQLRRHWLNGTTVALAGEVKQ